MATRPKIVKNENVVFFDIDDTLILYPKDGEDIVDPDYKVFIDFTGNKFLAKPALNHIKLIKYYYRRGFYCIVWSGNGYKHARNILQQLKILKYVDQIMTKPARYVDDVECSQWMGKRIYLEKGEKL